AAFRRSPAGRAGRRRRWFAALRGSHHFPRMRALSYQGPYKVKVVKKPDPRVEHPNDAILKVTRAAICGSDLHMLHGLVPDTRLGHTFGHEFTCLAEEVRPTVLNLAAGER